VRFVCAFVPNAQMHVNLARYPCPRPLRCCEQPISSVTSLASGLSTFLYASCYFGMRFAPWQRRDAGERKPRLSRAPLPRMLPLHARDHSDRSHKSRHTHGDRLAHPFAARSPSPEEHHRRDAEEPAHESERALVCLLGSRPRHGPLPALAARWPGRAADSGTDHTRHRAIQRGNADLEVKVNAILQLPTTTPTSKPTQSVTAKLSNLTPTINACGAVEPGRICQVPFPPPSPTPYPSCLQMADLSPGDWCVWPTEVPAANYSAFTD
jgi:hypothetical protein